MRFGRWFGRECHGHRFARGEDRWEAGRWDSDGLSGHEEGRRHGRRHGSGPRGERVFDQGDLRFVLLHLIAEKPSHGYELIKAIEDRLGGAYSPSPGVVYPTLTLLEELGHVRVDAAEGGRKLHTLTPEGRAFLDANKAVVDAILARMDAAAAARSGSRDPGVMRAIENLKLALRLRLSRGAVDPAAADAIAAALDLAARTIERA